jgi:hypothetical protein
MGEGHTTHANVFIQTVSLFYITPMIDGEKNDHYIHEDGGTY